MNCREVARVLEFEAESSAPPILALRRHWQACDACRDLYPDAGLLLLGVGSRRAASRRRRGAVLAAAAAAAVVIALCGWRPWAGSQAPAPAPTRESPTDAPAAEPALLGGRIVAHSSIEHLGPNQRGPKKVTATFSVLRSRP